MHTVVLARSPDAMRLPICKCLHAGDGRAHSRPSIGCMDIPGRLCAQLGGRYKGRGSCQVSGLPGTGPAWLCQAAPCPTVTGHLALAGLRLWNSDLQLQCLSGNPRNARHGIVLTLDQINCCSRNESLDAEHCKRLFAELLASVLPLLGEPSYNGTDSGEDPVGASPLAAAAKDCLQAVCNLLGPHAYIGIAAQLFLGCQSTGTEGVHLAEVTGAPPHSSQRLPRWFHGVLRKVRSSSSGCCM